jgi:hypothetical protein
MNPFKIALMLTLAVLLAGSVAALPLSVDQVKVDDVVLSANANNRFDVLRDNTIDVVVVFTPSEDISNMQVEGFFSGDEHSDVLPAYDAIPTFDADANVTYRKTLKIDLNQFFQEDSYKLRLIFSDRNGQELVQNYNLKIDVPRHDVMIRDIMFNPDSHLKAGSALLSVVRVRNTGENDEKDVKVTVSIAQLGISTSSYISEIRNNDNEKETEEMYLKIPTCAKAGVYDADIEVAFNDGFRKEHATKQVEVLADDTCGDAASPAAKTTISVGSQLENLPQSGTAIFPLTITNSARTSKSYTVGVSAADWADVKISPTSTFVLDGGKTQTVYVFVTASKDAPVGAQILTATVSSSGQNVQDIALTANVTASGKGILRTTLEWGLILLVVLLVILGLIIGFSRLKSDDEEQPSAPQTYY